MANFKIFADILQQGSTAGFAAAQTKQARDWYREKAGEVARVDQRTILNDKDRFAKVPLPGHMYIFSYDPKTKDDLPYYDRLPLIFPFRIVGSSMYGINMHYLPPVYRAQLMDALYSTVSDTKYDENTRLRITYDILTKASRYRFFKPCVKQYLNSHIRSRLVKIQPTEWDMALFLPLERFQKASKQRVFKESIKQFQR